MRSTLLLSLLAVSAVGSTQDWDPFGPVEKRGRMPASRSYAEAIRATAMMVNDPNAQRLAQARGLDILNVTWEDTGRYKGSSVRPEHQRHDHPSRDANSARLRGHRDARDSLPQL